MKHVIKAYINSWVAIQLLPEHYAYKTAGLPCSCYQSIMHIEQLSCHAAVTRVLCRNISCLVGLELSYGHSSSSNGFTLISGVVKQLNDSFFLFCNVPRMG